MEEVMKKFSLMILCTVLFIISCESEKDEVLGFPDLPDNFDWKWSDIGIEQVVEVSYYQEVDSLLFFLYSHSDDLSFSISVDSCNYCTNDFNVYNEEGCYYCTKVIDSPFSYNSTFAISLDLNGIEHIHEISIPAETEVVFPWYLYPNNDIQITWETETDPSFFLCRFASYDYANLIAPTCYNWNINGEKRSYKISKSKFNIYNYEIFQATLYSINYIRESDWMLYTCHGSGRLWSSVRNSGISAQPELDTHKFGKFSLLR